MDVRKRSAGDVTILSLSGDIMGVPEELNQFRSEVEQLIVENRLKAVVNLSRVDWISSIGIGTIISGIVSLRNANGEMVIADPSERVSKLLRVLHLSEVLRIFETEKGALAFLETWDGESKDAKAKGMKTG